MFLQILQTSCLCSELIIDETDGPKGWLELQWLDPIQGFANDVIWCLWGERNETLPGLAQHISLFTSYFIILCYSSFQQQRHNDSLNRKL